MPEVGVESTGADPIGSGLSGWGLELDAETGSVEVGRIAMVGVRVELGAPKSGYRLHPGKCELKVLEGVGSVHRG